VRSEAKAEICPNWLRKPLSHFVHVKAFALPAPSAGWVIWKGWNRMETRKEISDNVVATNQYLYDMICARLVLTSTRKAFRQKAKSQLKELRRINQRWRELRKSIADGIDVSSEAKELLESAEKNTKEKKAIYQRYKPKIVKYSRLVRGLQVLAETSAITVMGKPKPLRNIPAHYISLTKPKKRKRRPRSSRKSDRKVT